jgi:succinate dehydrogenase / fumarate reductase cytochrome b subunit
LGQRAEGFGLDGASRGRTATTMVGALSLYQTSIGKKILMAVTGLILFGYVFLHMYGNLHIYEGRQYFNEYSVWLREMGYPLFAHGVALWLLRIVLIVSLVGHVWAAWQVTRLDWESRPVRYGQKKMIAGTYAARTMRWGGVFLALFIVYHVLHFTLGTAYFEGPFSHTDVYSNVVIGFRNPIVSLVYIAAMIALGLHLYHGIWSMAQTLGWRSEVNNQLWRGFATVMAIVIAGGNISIPLAVMAGIVRL